MQTRGHSPQRVGKKPLLPRKVRRRLYLAVLALLVLSQVAFVASLNYQKICGSCHAIRAEYHAFHEGPHSMVNCTSCHSPARSTAFLETEFVAARNLLAYLTGRTGGPVYATVDNGRCLKCHEEVLLETIRTSKARIRHKDFVGLYNYCTDCHGGVGHRIEGRTYARGKMEECLSCHNNLTASADCQICHPGRKKDVLATRLDAYGPFHPPTFKKSHGLEDMRNCTVCHTPDYCASCHTVPLPHPDGWIYLHWQGTRSLEKACYQCHQEQNCTDCHKIKMPHPEGFLKIHAEEAKKYGTSFCLRCHDENSCAACHTEHVHPNFGTFHTPEKVLKR